MKMTFQPKKRQRSKEHGFRKRMRTANGRKVLAARRKKGRAKFLQEESLGYVDAGSVTMATLIKAMSDFVKEQKA